MTVTSSGLALDDVQRRVCDAVASVVPSDGAADAPPMAPSTSLWDIGMNSVLAVSLASALEGEFGVSLPASVAFDYGTLKDLAGFIHTKYFLGTPTATEAGTSSTTTIAVSSSTAKSGAAGSLSVLETGVVTRRTTTPLLRRRVSKRISRTVSVGVAPPEPEPLTVRDVVVSVLMQFLPQTQQLGDRDADAPSLWSMGLSSVTAVQLVTSLSDRLQVLLPPTLLFDYPTVDDVVKYAEAQRPPGLIVESDSPKQILDASAIEVARSISSSMYSSSFGRGGGDPAVFVTDASTTLAESSTSAPLCPSDAIVSVPRCRWDPDRSEDSGLVESRFGHFLSTVGHFDTAYFGSTASEAVLMDPQQRLLLHQCNGPATVGRIPDAHFGVYAAISQFEYAIDVQTHGHFVAYAATGSAHSVACGRLSYTYGLSGPCVSVDTACSSALVASHLLRKGVSGEECDQGIAAAVNLALSRHTNVMFVRAGMLTQDGRCKTLDAAADGYVRQEACGVIAVTDASNVPHKTSQLLAANIEIDGVSVSRATSVSQTEE